MYEENNKYCIVATRHVEMTILSFIHLHKVFFFFIFRKFSQKREERV